ncbi:MAG: DUF192 domain-containing protein [Fluviicoccus sp.]|uniref:DUF192 domain-containing protein n=1 Tax=Fluviicoccus sp. TaxID=2003552 RepID=UPI0027235A32|nr:DUF192 domain-containing protein [Fluviicoccus sp.]MDO8331312.1 DUF192 domain-containing protein [Fluviicoccus sp.]
MDGTMVETPAGYLQITPAVTFTRRLAGLLGARSLGRDEALLLYPCAGIHTLGMRFAIDVLFLDAGGLPLQQQSCVLPWRLVTAPPQTVMTLELAAGRLDRNYCDGLKWSGLAAIARGLTRA